MPLSWRLLRLVLGGSRNQAFLDRAWIAWLLAVVPRSARPGLALRLLAFSPHYFIHQWSARYGVGTSRGEVLQAEHQRNRASRKEICAHVLRPHLRPDMTVLDFGCGAGYLAREVSAHVTTVVAVDVSGGAIACAKVLNPAPNVEYRVNRADALTAIADDSIDLAYSFAVLQHLDRDRSRRSLAELARVLKPAGHGLCHFAVAPSPAAAGGDRHGRSPLWRYRRFYSLHFETMSESEIRSLLEEAGFSGVTIVPIATLGKVHDDIGRQHVAVFRKPVER